MIVFDILLHHHCIPAVFRPPADEPVFAEVRGRGWRACGRAGGGSSGSRRLEKDAWSEAIAPVAAHTRVPYQDKASRTARTAHYAQRLGFACRLARKCAHGDSKQSLRQDAPSMQGSIPDSAVHSVVGERHLARFLGCLHGLVAAPLCQDRPSHGWPIGHSLRSRTRSIVILAEYDGFRSAHFSAGHGLGRRGFGHATQKLEEWLNKVQLSSTTIG
eukprot:2559771-Rhodomonas_salina.1